MCWRCADRLSRYAFSLTASRVWDHDGRGSNGAAHHSTVRRGPRGTTNPSGPAGRTQSPAHPITNDRQESRVLAQMRRDPYLQARVPQDSPSGGPGKVALHVPSHKEEVGHEKDSRGPAPDALFHPRSDVGAGRLEKTMFD